MDKPELREDEREPTRENTGAKNSQAAEVEQGEAEETGPEEDEVISRLQEDLEAAKDKYIRLYSEFENFRKRTAKEKLELTQSANEQLLRTLLPVADDFERAERAFRETGEKSAEGFTLIYSKFKKILDLYGARPMDVEPGADFNADFHEAISQVAAPAPEFKGKVVDVVEKGYLLNDKVIRYAKVVVGN